MDVTEIQGTSDMAAEVEVEDGQLLTGGIMVEGETLVGPSPGLGEGIPMIVGAVVLEGAKGERVTRTLVPYGSSIHTLCNRLSYTLFGALLPYLHITFFFLKCY